MPEPKANTLNIPHLGLLAGKGRFPFLLAKAAADLGIPVTVIAFNGITPVELGQQVNQIHWMELGQVSRVLETLHAEGIRHVIMAGQVAHNSIWRYRGFDMRGLKILGKMINRKADSILGAVVAELKREGIEVVDQSLLIRSCMPAKGLLTPGRPLTPREEKDVEFGFPIARQIAGMDIGQTLIVKDLAVVAVESLEGTDEAIRRAGRIAEGGIVVIKVCKPHQDSRFDIPVVGPQTIRSLTESGGGALVFMANETIFFDQLEAIELARTAGIAVAAI